MLKRKTLTKKSVKTAVDSSSGRMVIEAQKRDVISPGPSQDAVKKIERLEASTLRAEQRLGLIRLA